MLVIVVAGGDLPVAGTPGDDPTTQAMRDADLLIAADGGLVHCVAHGVWPHVLIGDLDSAPQSLIDEAPAHGVETIEYPTDKDATDLELAMELGASRGASRLMVLGVFGGRVDHELANLALIASDRWSEIAVSAGDGLRTVWVVTQRLVLRQDPGTLLTLVPWGGDAVGVTTSGMQWPLNRETLVTGSTRGVSNVCLDPDQSISVEHGTLLVVVDRSLISER